MRSPVSTTGDDPGGRGTDEVVFSTKDRVELGFGPGVGIGARLFNLMRKEPTHSGSSDAIEEIGLKTHILVVRTYALTFDKNYSTMLSDLHFDGSYYIYDEAACINLYLTFSL